MDLETVLTLLEKHGLQQPAHVTSFRGHVRHGPYGQLAVRIEIHEFTEMRRPQDKFQAVAYALDGSPLVKGGEAGSPEAAIGKLDWAEVGLKASEWVERHSGYKVRDFQSIPDEPTEASHN